MLKKKIKYVDYDDNVREETFHFNLNKVEISDLNLTTEGGLDSFIRRVSETSDEVAVLKMFKQIILISVGRKSPDGKQFVKNDQIRSEFEQSEAFVELYTELLSDPDKANAFIQGIIPKSLKAEN